MLKHDVIFANDEMCTKLHFQQYWRHDFEIKDILPNGSSSSGNGCWLEVLIKNLPKQEAFVGKHCLENSASVKRLRKIIKSLWQWVILFGNILSLLWHNIRQTFIVGIFFGLFS